MIFTGAGGVLRYKQSLSAYQVIESLQSQAVKPLAVFSVIAVLQ